MRREREEELTQEELLAKYGVKVNKACEGPNKPVEMLVREWNGVLTITIIEAPVNENNRVTQSKTEIVTKEGKLEVLGATGASAKAAEKGRQSKDTGDFHMTTVFYKPEWYLAAVGSSFDFLSPYSRKLVEEKFAGISKEQLEEMKQELGFEAEALTDIDIVGKQVMRQWPESRDSDHWEFETINNLNRGVSKDKNGAVFDEADSNEAMPNTQLKMRGILQNIWERQSMLLGDLVHKIKQSLPDIDEEIFAYYFNAVFANSIMVIPLWNPPKEYYSLWGKERLGIQLTCVTNADLMTIAAQDPNGIVKKLKGKRNLGYGEMQSIAEKMGVANGNANVDRLIQELKKRGWSDKRIEKELLQKARDGSYTTLDTARDRGPRWTTKQEGYSTTYPINPVVGVSRLQFHHFTDGVTHVDRNLNRSEEIVDTVPNAAAWLGLVETGEPLGNSFAWADDGDILSVRFVPNKEFGRDMKWENYLWNWRKG